MVHPVNNLKVKNPNTTGKARHHTHTHETHFSQSMSHHDDSLSQLHRAHAQIRQLEEQIRLATAENEELKLMRYGRAAEQERAGSSVLDALENKIQAKVRSISVEPMGEPMGKSRVPRLRLEVLPNYHGKSKESLNESLLEAYSKGQKC